MYVVLPFECTIGTIRTSVCAGSNVFLTEKYNQLVEFNHQEEKPIIEMLACVREIIAKLSEDINRIKNSKKIESEKLC